MKEILETIIEPTKIEVGSIFKLKIKAIRFTTYNEFKTNQKTYNDLNSYTYGDLKGDK